MMRMAALLPKILHMSLTAGIVIVLVLFVRLLLRKAPKIFSYALWAVVLFRLVCPVSFSSELSLLGLFHVPAAANANIAYIPADIGHTGYLGAGLPGLPLPTADDAINDNLFQSGSLSQGGEQLAADPPEWPMAAATALWLLGIAAMLIYSAVSLARLRRKLIGAVRLRDNIYLADHIATPFVIGVVRPKIYLPSTLATREQEQVCSCIILHEQTHIRRLDHIFKMIAFLALAVHWFNPLVWAAFTCAVKDMEMSCDERVLKEMGGEIKRAYSASLLSLATGRHLINGSPLAFGEGNIKGRIRNVMNFKKPAAWGVAVSAVLVVTLSVGFAANRVDDSDKRDDDFSVPSAAGGSGNGDEHEPQALRQAAEQGMLIAKADFNRDGRDEAVYLDKSQIDNGFVVLRVLEDDGNELWNEQFSTSHAGWGMLFLYEQDGKYCLLRYNPGMYQGYCTYVYTLFTPEDGRENVIRTNTLEFDVNGTKKLDVPEMIAFADEVNALLGKSTLLISSDGGSYAFGPSSPEPFFERYSWLDDYPELYEDGDSLGERLEKYSEYAIFNSSEEGQAFQLAAYNFAKAFFSKNTEVLKSYLLNPDKDFHECDLNYDFEDIKHLRLKFDPDDVKDGSASAQYEFIPNGEDSYTYLQLNMKKVNNAWKIEFYGLEK